MSFLGYDTFLDQLAYFSYSIYLYGTESAPEFYKSYGLKYNQRRYRQYFQILEEVSTRGPG